MYCRERSASEKGWKNAEPKCKSRFVNVIYLARELQELYDMWFIGRADKKRMYKHSTPGRRTKPELETSQAAVIKACAKKKNQKFLEPIESLC